MNVYILGLLWFIAIGITAIWAVSRISKDNKRERERQKLIEKWREYNKNKNGKRK